MEKEEAEEEVVVVVVHAEEGAKEEVEGNGVTQPFRTMEKEEAVVETEKEEAVVDAIIILVVEVVGVEEINGLVEMYVLSFFFHSLDALISCPFVYYFISYTSHTISYGLYHTTIH